MNQTLAEQFLAHVTNNLPGYNQLTLVEFFSRQFPIAYEAIEGGRGIQACTASAHDMTCAFVTARLFERA